jgi:hypothetical protein
MSYQFFDILSIFPYFPYLSLALAKTHRKNGQTSGLVRISNFEICQHPKN